MKLLTMIVEDNNIKAIKLLEHIADTLDTELEIYTTTAESFFEIIEDFKQTLSEKDSEILSLQDEIDTLNNG